jgi:hypothetical protein
LNKIAPLITTPVENATVPIGEDVSLSCEVRAYPGKAVNNVHVFFSGFYILNFTMKIAPVLHWEFLAEGNDGMPQILPGTK